MNNIYIQPFNNNIETGLRILSILNAAFPNSFDLQTLIYLDYLTVHSGDIINGIESLHPATPTRKGELYIRRTIISKSLEIFEIKGLIKKQFNKEGITYSADEYAAPFIECLSEEYSMKLIAKAQWVVNNFNNVGAHELNKYMNKFMINDSDNLNINTIINE